MLLFGGGIKMLFVNLFVYDEIDFIFFKILRECKNVRGEWLIFIVFLYKVLYKADLRSNFEF